MNMKMITNYITYVAIFMGIIALFRYFIDGSLERWDWWRSLFIAAVIGGYNVWRNNKRGAYDQA